MNALQMETGHKRDKQDIPLLARNGVKALIAVGMGHLWDIWDMRLCLKWIKSKPTKGQKGHCKEHVETIS
jgi:hypothetical protein